ncbi:DUF3606 domain-containing protein [Bordetella sp. BOR01]|uniref:DUF3606 domain-containing protein n=1 Tax=Bordetella sp. BOR01 TaxID=2854779 RepID=UPI001C48A97B|nr:DUF3606 domain-containing protein [Bordetella sp. BOR01]MBV7485812.1 DUF3606 domain-containing protein [Bordetella sp. BOR01]
MNDNLHDRGPRDRSRVNIDEEWERHYWSQELGITVEQLQEAVHQVGPSVENVQAYLATPATGRTT